MKLKIDIWTDFVCQFCYIGKRELELAIEKTGMKDLVDIDYHSYQLTPDAPTESGTLFYDFAVGHMGLAHDQIQEMASATIERAASLGLVYRFDDMMHQNTLKAHRISKYAKEVGLGKEYQERMFYAVFTENIFIADTDNLVKLAAEVGLNEDKVREIADNENAYYDEVREDIYNASQIGVRGVPFYVFNNQYAVSGAQPGELFVELLEKLKLELNLKTSLVMVGDTDEACGPDGCAI